MSFGRWPLARVMAMVMVALTQAPPLEALDAPLWAPFSYPTGEVVDPRTVQVVDVDLDGDLDLVGGDGPSGALWSYRYARGAGWAFAPLADGPDGLLELVVADLDTDGDPDLAGIAAVGPTGTLFWVENPGSNPGSWTVATIETLTAGVGDFSFHDLEVGDMDHDGRPDLLVALQATMAGADRRCGWWTRSSGSWSRTEIVDVDVEVLSLAVGDVDRDGTADLATAGLDQVTGNLVVDWWQGAAAGTSWVRHPILAGPAQDWVRVRLGDREHDGDLDLLLVDVPGDFGTDRGLRWRLNTGVGAAWTVTPPTHAPGDFDGTPAVADLDHDGTLDIAYGDAGGALHVFRTEPGTLALVADPPVFGALRMAGEVTTGDLDQDGDLEIVALNDLTDRVVRWLDYARLHGRTIADGAPAPLVDPIFPVPASATDPVAADLDGDGDLDLAVPVPSIDDTYLLLNANGGTSWTPTTLPGTLAGAAAAAAGDVDGDGTVDLVIAGFGADEVRLYRNTAGNAATWDQVTVGAAVDGVSAVVVVDLDRDGDLDVATVALIAGRVEWYRNDGSGTSWTPREIDPAFPFPYGVAAGNLDGDGDVDLVAWGSAGVRWYENNLVNHTPPGLEGYPDWDLRPIVNGLDVTTVALVDWDADGDLDVAANDSVADELLLYRNSGLGQVTLPQTLLLAPAIARVTSADLDHDGRIELLASRYDVSQLIQLEVTSVGANGFLSMTWDLATAFDSLWGVTVGDLDGDGDDDLALLEGGTTPGLGWIPLDREAVGLELEDLAPVIPGGASAAFGRLRLSYYGHPVSDPEIDLAAVAVAAGQVAGGEGVVFGDFCSRLGLYRDAAGAGGGAWDPSDPLVAETQGPPAGIEVLVAGANDPAARVMTAPVAPEIAEFWLVCDAVPVVPPWLPAATFQAQLLGRPQGTAVDLAGSDVPASPLVLRGGTATVQIADPLLFADDFESGNFAAWSSHSP